ncbi:UTP:RNA uridylyltransferase 1-like isoform X2 [Camellia sinensis]|uniref:UTP:RNA uridylyltransferase 1-like isoform X2 n=1 Tax=Camellia sinensis TaxID=4442 RepID=UPI001035B260|nr:UTP:RNA uridylyltransferase 1-like isoform X2 [Camellia sinensis]
MAGGGGDNFPPRSPPPDGGEFLLQLLQKPPHQPPTLPHQIRQPPSSAATPQPPSPAQNLSHDPAVAAVGRSLPLPPFQSNGHDLPYNRPTPFRHPPLPLPPFQSNGHDLPYNRPTPFRHPPPFAPHNFFPQGFPQNPSPIPNPSPSPSPSHSHNFQFNRQLLTDDIRKLGFSEPVHRHEQKLMFGSFPCEIRNNEGVSDSNMLRNIAPAAKIDGLSSKEREIGEGNRGINGLEVDFQNFPNISRNPRSNSNAFQNQEPERRNSGSGGRWGNSSSEVRRPPPGFSSKPSNIGNWDSGKKRSFKHNVDRERSSFGDLSYGASTSKNEGTREKRLLPENRKIGGDLVAERKLSSKLDYPGPPAGSNLHSVSASDIEESSMELHGEIGENGEKPRYRLEENMRRGGGPGQSELNDSDERILGSSEIEDGSDDKKDRKQHKNSRDKDYRSDTRGQMLLGQRMRNSKRQIECRRDIDRLNARFLGIYESLIPPDEEKVKQKQLVTLLKKLVIKEWPEAELYIYGSCGNSFGVSKSDIDVCLAIEDLDVNKSEVLLKLADILQSDNLQNVQALTRARVPIVKLMDPVTGISCDICINNLLAVVNTKLLRDYAKIDARLRQLAFIVKHWAKSRGVNETYRGTLSSYAYVLMCIHFLQQRKPAILPCLQGMEITYAVTVDNVECAYFDQVEKLSSFGSRNKESIAQLVWAFFNYWAYWHDYANDVLSVRTGSVLSKRGKDWTRRIGNDRHLICIEDPFETSHDLGRVVDKFSIRVLREEFERAAEIMQYDPDPCVTLFEPYVPI